MRRTGDKTEDFMNLLTDSDWGWYPFVFLKPSKKSYMTTPFVLKASLLYAPTYVFAITFLMYIRGFPIDLVSLIIYTVCFTFIFFVCYRLTFAVYWNRRAKRLNESS
jgi:hypothetical protein